MTKPYFDHHHRVLEDEIDRQGHVNNLRFLAWTLQAAAAHSASVGWNDQRRTETGCDWVVRAHDITYRQSVFAGDDIVVRTWVADMQRYASRRCYLICRPRDQALLARAETKWVFVSLQERKAVSIPEDQTSAYPVVDVAPLPWQA